MTMKEITDGLKTLLSDNHYNPVTIQFYEREWKKIQAFLLAEYGDEGFDIFELVNEIDDGAEGNNIDALNNLGVCYRKGESDQKKAKEIFESLEQRGNKFASINLYKLYLARGIEQNEEVFSALKERCDSTGSTQLKFIMGIYYEEKRDYVAAAKLFEEVCAPAPHST